MLLSQLYTTLFLVNGAWCYVISYKIEMIARDLLQKRCINNKVCVSN
jgi:hypothetical protein